MRLHRLTELGLVCLASAFVLALLGFVLPYFWDAVLVRGSAEVLFGQSLRLFWIPIAGNLVFLSTGILGLVGFALLWRGRWEFGPEYASRLGLSLLALVLAGIALALWTATGILLGLFSGLSGLIPWRHVLAFVATASLGFALYWVLASLPLHGTRPVAAVAFAIGVAGGAVTLLATLGFRRAEAIGLEGAGAALSLVSLVLWFALCVWGSQSLRSSRGGPPSVTPARGA